MMSHLRDARLVLIGLVAVSGGARALAQGAEQPAKPGTVRQFIAQSDLVFHGSVVAVEYVNSLPSQDSAAGIPHTFVTYRVHDVLHGQTDGEEITLRFLGGYDFVSETYLAASVSPQFDVGDEDVLFVRGNGRSPCPLVENSRGRLRVIGGQAYSDTGRALSLMPDGTILRGERYDLPEVWMTDVLGEVLAIGRDPDAARGPSDAISRERLLEFVGVSGMNAQPARVRFASADMQAPFASPMPGPAPMRDSMPPDAPVAEPVERDLPSTGTQDE